MMSPASQGSLEVEHYIGSNLISSSARINHPRHAGKGRKPDANPKNGKVVLHRCGDHQYRNANRGNYPVPGMVPLCGCGGNFGFPPRPGQFTSPGWANVPIIPVPNKNGRKGAGNKAIHHEDRARTVGVGEEESSFRTPLSRLAIHTQGAPLILSGRCSNNNNSRKNSNRVVGRAEIVIRRSNKYKDSHGQSGTSDCLSVASDESSGSGHSENCLPRIIKPRKRRKKDRKPPGSPKENTVSEEADAPTVETHKTFSPLFYETRILPETKNGAQLCDSKPSVPAFASTVSKLTCHGSLSEEAGEDELSGPRLHHSFEEVAESDPFAFPCSPSSCQCRYCDPSGIWDAPEDSFLGSKGFLPNPPPTHSDLVLRRSWSEPTHSQQQYNLWSDSRDLPSRSNSFSEADSWESLKGCDITSSGDKCVGRENLNNRNPCLQVSTEIVTSPNGHRDIEIRFYSASPPA